MWSAGPHFDVRIYPKPESSRDVLGFLLHAVSFFFCFFSLLMFTPAGHGLFFQVCCFLLFWAKLEYHKLSLSAGQSTKKSRPPKETAAVIGGCEYRLGREGRRTTTGLLQLSHLFR